MQRRTVISSPIGPLTLTADEPGALTGLSMAGWRGHSEDPEPDNHPAGFERVIEQLDAYFAGQLERFEVDVAPRGNRFNQSVWRLLQAIPFGETRTYGELAGALGDKSLARAVGAACGANPIGVIIPCHRVIGADGSLTGFGGGLENKEFLLHLENPARPIKLRLFA